MQDHGKRWSGTHVTVWFRPGGAACARFGLTVSRRVGNAVVRNRVKRWLREAFRRVRAEFPLVDVVCVARPSAATAGWVGLATDVDAVFGWLVRLPQRPTVTR